MNEDIKKMIDEIDDDRFLKHIKFIIIGYMQKIRDYNI